MWCWRLLVCVGLGGIALHSTDRECGSASTLTGRSSTCGRGHALEAELGGTDSDPIATERLRRVGRILNERIRKPAVPCRYKILKSDQKNAYSLSCGCIYVTRGLYGDLVTDDLLAAVLAHEMAHVVERDGRKPPAEPPVHLQREMTADRYAAGYLREAGYRSESLPAVIALLKQDQPSGWAEARLARLRDPLMTDGFAEPLNRVSTPRPMHP